MSDKITDALSRLELAKDAIDSAIEVLESPEAPPTTYFSFGIQEELVVYSNEAAPEITSISGTFEQGLELRNSKDLSVSLFGSGTVGFRIPTSSPCHNVTITGDIQDTLEDGVRIGEGSTGIKLESLYTVNTATNDTAGMFHAFYLLCPDVEVKGCSVSDNNGDGGFNFRSTFVLEDSYVDGSGPWGGGAPKIRVNPDYNSGPSGVCRISGCTLDGPGKNIQVDRPADHLTNPPKKLIIENVSAISADSPLYVIDQWWYDNAEVELKNNYLNGVPVESIPAPVVIPDPATPPTLAEKLDDPRYTKIEVPLWVPRTEVFINEAFFASFREIPELDITASSLLQGPVFEFHTPSYLYRNQFGETKSTNTGIGHGICRPALLGPNKITGYVQNPENPYLIGVGTTIITGRVFVPDTVIFLSKETTNIQEKLNSSGPNLEINLVDDLDHKDIGTLSIRGKDNVKISGSGAVLKATGNDKKASLISIRDHSPNGTILIKDINFEGGYDAETGIAATTSPDGIILDAASDGSRIGNVTINNCDFRGLWTGVTVLGQGATSQALISCSGTDWQTYGAGTSGSSVVGSFGNVWQQNPRALRRADGKERAVPGGSAQAANHAGERWTNVVDYYCDYGYYESLPNWFAQGNKIPNPNIRIYNETSLMGWHSVTNTTFKFASLHKGRPNPDPKKSPVPAANYLLSRKNTFKEMLGAPWELRSVGGLFADDCTVELASARKALLSIDDWDKMEGVSQEARTAPIILKDIKVTGASFGKIAKNSWDGMKLVYENVTINGEPVE